MEVSSIVLTLGFGLWVSLTLINSTQRGTGWLMQRLGPMHIFIPKWNFFSPHPGQYDYYLLFRDKRIDGSVTDWQQIEGVNGEPGLLRPLWNPAIYRSKLLFDIAANLTSNVKQFNEEKIRSVLTGERTVGTDSDLVSVDLGAIELSVSYLTVLHYVTEHDHDQLSESTQFMLMRHSRASDQYEPLLVSRFHDLEA